MGSFPAARERVPGDYADPRISILPPPPLRPLQKGFFDLHATSRSGPNLWHKTQRPSSLCYHHSTEIKKAVISYCGSTSKRTLSMHPMYCSARVRFRLCPIIQMSVNKLDFLSNVFNRSVRFVAGLRVHCANGRWTSTRKDPKSVAFAKLKVVRALRASKSVTCWWYSN